MSDSKHEGRNSGVVLGIILVLLGVVFLLDQLEFWEAHRVLQFWPTVVMLLLLIHMARPGHKPDVLWVIFVLIGGVLLQLHTLHIVHVGFHALWPLLIILLGVHIFRSALRRQSNREPSKVNPTSTLNDRVLFGGQELKVDSPDFKGGSVEAVFGGYHLDLRQADFPPGEVVLEVKAVFGGVEINVPGNWSVTVQGSPVMGAFEDKTRHPVLEPGQQEKRLIITGSAVFGGVEIKN